MIYYNECYNTETKEHDRTYYWYDENLIRHEFNSCYDAVTDLEKYMSELEEKLCSQN